MILVGLTGGIGSGKSEVSTLLSERGAVIIDGDVIARQLQQPGTPVFAKMVEEFGDAIVDEHGKLRRALLASIVFPDPEKLASLNAIVHPALTQEIDRRLAALRATSDVVVLDMPLLAENPRKGLCGVIVVDVDPKIARKRLVVQRNMEPADIDARMARQATREARNALADQIIDNSGDKEQLRAQVERVWSWITQLAPAAPDAGSLSN